MALDSAGFPARFADLERRVEADYYAMRPWLPALATDLLDIGCGHYPLIDIWLAVHYGDGLAIHLMDGDEHVPGGKGDMFTKHKRPYNSRHVGLMFLRERLPNIMLYEQPPDPTATIPCDLIISRRAWGHHFPIATYLSLADRSLRPGGRIIVDIRTGHETADGFFRAGFQVLADDLEVRSVKCKRFVLSR